MTLGNRGNTHEFHEFQFHDFSPSNYLKLQFLPYSGRFIYLTFALTLINMNKTMKSGTLLSEVAISRMK